MTIKAFARLCGCNPQTLRYYDHVNLLKPSRVDEWTGYRHYDEDQAVQFVEIKNLQKAGFTIGEIKGLLKKGHSAICRAFDEKIAAAEAQLREIKGIQASYQAEMNEMKEKIRELQEQIAGMMARYDPREEFGISSEEYEGVLSTMSELFDKAVDSPDANRIRMVDDQEREPDFLRDPQYEVIFEKHGWQNVKEFFPVCCDLEGGRGCVLVLRIDAKKNAHSAAVANTILGLMLNKNQNKERSIGCNVDLSEDGINHFWMLRKKK